MNRPDLRVPATKRAVDIALSAAALIVLSPIVAAIAAAIRLFDGSPVLFRQERAGLGGRAFDLVKFRTMRIPATADDEDPDNDAVRMTKLGRFLRSTSLDELPTLWNVVRGDMSLVGPRPLPVRYLPRYTPHQARRHDTPPGVTGLAQVAGRNTLPWDERLALDIDYVDTRSFAGDVAILAKTLVQVLRREGISNDEHATMPEFRGTTPERSDG